MRLVKMIYDLTEYFPQSERFGLISQMQRCAVSIPSNIAEGSRRDSNKEFRRFILIALGSGAELETQIQISKDLGYAGNTLQVDMLLEEIMKMLNALQKKLSA